MFRTIKRFVLVGIAVGVVMSCSSLAFAKTPKQYAPAERYRNDNNDNPKKTAKCLIKYLQDWEVNESGKPKSPWSDIFATFKVEYVGASWVVITCYDGEVGPDEKVRVTFDGTATSSDATVLSAEWYENENNGACSNLFKPDPTPVPFIDVETQDSTLNVVVKHGAREWDHVQNQPGDSLGTIYGSHVYYAVAPRFLPLDELGEDLWTCHDGDVPIPGAACVTNGDCSPGTCGPPPGLIWEDPDPAGRPATFQLEYEGSVSYNLSEYDEDDVILFRFYTEPNPIHGYSNFELVQFCVTEFCIPAVSGWGMVVIALLVLAAGTVMIRRRRAMAAQA